MNRPVAGLKGLSVAVALVLMLSARLCAAQEITVAAAADLQFAMQEVGTRFQQESGKTVKLIYGSSGNFAQQLQNGAPFDMFFSANLDYPRQLEAAGIVAAGARADEHRADEYCDPRRDHDEAMVDAPACYAAHFRSSLVGPRESETSATKLWSSPLVVVGPADALLLPRQVRT